MTMPSPSVLAAIARSGSTEAGSPGADAASTGDAHPDAELLRLGKRLDELWAVERLAGEAHRVAKDWATDDAFMEAVRLSGEVVDEIEDLTATTLEGLQVKVRACSWCLAGASFDDHTFGDKSILNPGPTTDVRLASSILRDLAAMGGS